MEDCPASIDKYEIVRVLGRGATSTVYLAYDAFSERQVAVKLFAAAALADPAQGATFRKLLATEASLAGRLDHPHIMAIRDAVLGAERSYLVLEYVAGESLERYCAPDRLLPIDKVVEIAFKCALALDYASRNGVIHRDIKPANIMLTAAGDVKIADFGAALLTCSDATQLLGVGSPSYMSPEQLRMEPLTTQTDIYSLGVVMYRLLTGRLPFEADNNYALSHRILNGEPAPLRALRPALPARLEQVVMRALEKEPARRYADWRAFSAELAGLAALDLPGEATSETEKFEALRALPFFAAFDDIALWEVLRIGTWELFPTASCLLREGDRGDFFFILVDGDVSLGRDGKHLGRLAKGSCLGEMCYIRRGTLTRTATVAAATPATVLKIQAASLRNASDACQLAFNRAFLDVLVDRLAAADISLARAS